MIFVGCTSAQEDLGGEVDGGGEVIIDPNMMMEPMDMVPPMDPNTNDGGMMTPTTSPDGSVAQPGTVGAACTSGNMCAGTMAACITGWPGGYCSIASCEPGTCPTGSDCYEMANNTTRCLKDCTTRNDCRTGYACHSVGACTPACTATSCDAGEVCGADGLCGTAPCQQTGCASGQVCSAGGSCIIDMAGGPGAGPGPTCASLPVRDCSGTDCTTISSFLPVMGPGYDNYPLNGETAANQYRSYANKTLQMLVKYASAYVACKSAMWTGGNGFAIGLGDMSESNGAIPGTSIGQPGHPAGTHVNGRDMDIAYHQVTSANNFLRPICPYISGGADQNRCVGEPNNLDVWRTALFIGAMLASPKTRVIGVDGKVGPHIVRVLPNLCGQGWLPQAACTNMNKLAYETTNMGQGWYYFHHHHLHISTN